MSKLYEHQKTGAAWLAKNPKGYLADVPGLGKTRTLIAGLGKLGVERPLIVCPAIVRSHWWRELDEMDFDGLPLVKSYDEITRGGNALMKSNFQLEEIDALVLDEAHYLKHATSQRTRQLLGKDGYARRLDVVLSASGTPLPRNPAEIWTNLSALHPELPLRYGVKTYADFVERYCVTRGSMVRGVWREKVVGLKDEALPELHAMLGEMMLARTLDDVGLDVPRIDWQLMLLDGGEFSLPDDGAEEVQRLLWHNQWDESLADIAEDPHVARMRRRLGELKAPLVVEMLTAQLEADPKMKVAVFAHHRSVLAKLLTIPVGHAYVDGDTPPHRRDEDIDSFVTDPHCRLFIGQNLACSTGMDGLQHATNRAVLVEPDWSADVNYQLGKRVARIGSAHDHAVVQMVALAGTLDEAIVAQNKRETEMVEAVMDRKEAGC